MKKFIAWRYHRKNEKTQKKEGTAQDKDESWSHDMLV